ncbi:hypothetical protein AVEN_119378-1 [Araneus ventricosus]|uniref:Uncharacterized protein n=1 Tax=Araneus ventricosus TaxID=182803 RepID=A0A4Y2SVH0_ARAVE|nr:hypothetical protein AVEN_89347-1 [Araneus ventricosus]GBN91146.1 hypothetical protein AVEN_225122-1 [Araneus ventricosus]GBN91187.1 hypothetical protein AVEN_221640-1 [Araneus ventricosus]GBN91468.1 hypothetical protein AVEN_119378-1 [Araneus ventricosus]
MDYPYLNQPTFDPSCSLGTMELPSCQLPCSYADLGSCSQMTSAYRYSTAAVPRSFGGPTAVGPPPCGMVAARPRHDQGPASVFSSAGMALQKDGIPPPWSKPPGASAAPVAAIGGMEPFAFKRRGFGNSVTAERGLRAGGAERVLRRKGKGRPEIK